MVSGGGLYWAGRRLAHRQAVIPRWPVEQKASSGKSTAIAAVVPSVGTGVGKTYLLTRRGAELYFGERWGRTALARGVNAGLWAAGAVGGVQRGDRRDRAVEREGRAGLRDAARVAAVSGSADSMSRFAETRAAGPPLRDRRRDPGNDRGRDGGAGACRTRSGPTSGSTRSRCTARAEPSSPSTSSSGPDAFDRSYLLLVSPTGTGWVDQTVVEAAEFLARGDIATCSVQYGRFPSFLAVQKVGLGRSQFRLLLWGIRQRLRERPPERRPKVLVFGESLGAWTSSDVVMAQGITGFDHYGVDRALWFGLPALAKWSRNGMATGSNELVPEGAVGVFDRHEQLAALTDDERDRLRAVILSHDNDPIACLRPELMIREPDWLQAETQGATCPTT